MNFANDVLLIPRRCCIFRKMVCFCKSSDGGNVKGMPSPDINQLQASQKYFPLFPLFPLQHRSHTAVDEHGLACGAGTGVGGKIDQRSI